MIADLSRANIIELVDKIKSHYFGKSFVFRKGQREAVEEICKIFIEGAYDTVILDAPTGTGKSIVAIFAAKVLSELGNTGYLVASDISLQDQYEKDIKQLNLKWGSVKGVDNYDCEINGKKFSLGECRIRGMNQEQAKKLHCFSSCGYYQNRLKAIASPVTLMNYSYWLVQQNYVAKKMREEGKPIPFPRRDFCFFDEAHKIDEIVQSHFSPRIELDMPQKLNEASNFLKREGFEYPYEDFTKFKKIQREIFATEDKLKLFELLESLEMILFKYVRVSGQVKQIAEKKFPIEVVAMPGEWKRAMYLFDWIKDVHCKIEDYTDILEKIGLDALVKNGKDEEVLFQCLDESYLIAKHFHAKVNFKVLMSATFGNKHKYAKLIALQKAKVIKLNNGFDYSKSPVYNISKFKLSFREREKNLPKVIKILDRIIEKRHPNEKGIIHTGSYVFMKEILKNSRNTERFIQYENTTEKREALTEFYESENKILIGPSILEGIDLFQERSRFQIFFKVPFPSLGDPLVKDKLRISQDWYDWKTSISILQGTGRSVRSKDDWAVTYFLDGCFNDLVKKKGFFPEDFLERVIEI